MSFSAKDLQLMSSKGAQTKNTVTLWDESWSQTRLEESEKGLNVGALERF